MLDFKMLAKIFCIQLSILSFSSLSNAQVNLREQFIEQKRMEIENQKIEDQRRANVDRQRAKDESQRISYIRELEKQALQDSVVFTCDDSATACAPVFRSPSGKCWGTVVRFNKGSVYVFPENWSPSLWHNQAPTSENFSYDSKSEIISWARQDDYIQYNLGLSDNSLYVKMDMSKPDIRKYSCNLTHGSKSSIIPKPKKSVRVMKYDDYVAIRKKLIAEGWKSFRNPYLDKSSPEVKYAIKLNKILGFHELDQCFTRGSNLFSCDASWTYTENKENSELILGILVDSANKKALVEEDAISK